MSESIGVRGGKPLGYREVKATYTAEEISRRFHLERGEIRRLARSGLIPPAAAQDGGDVYDFRGLVLFRRVRDLRARGLGLRQIEAELGGQPYLFEHTGVARPADVVALEPKRTGPPARGPFEEGLLLAAADDPGAEASFRRAIAEGDHVADAYCNLAPIAQRAGRQVEAFDFLTLALREDPRHVEAHHNLATFYLDAGQHALARLHYELATVIEPYFPDPYYNLGIVCAELGDLAAARRALETYSQLVGEGDQGAVEGLLALLRAATAFSKSPAQEPPVRR